MLCALDFIGCVDVEKIKMEKGDGWIYFVSPQSGFTRIRIVAQNTRRFCHMCYTRNVVVLRQYPGTVTGHSGYCEECFVTHKDFLVPIAPSEVEGWE